MKAFILCGGNGSRLDNEGKIKPKALIKIGDNPILIHLMKSLIKNEFKEFVLCLGYKKEDIENSVTGGRIKIANQIVKNKADFFMTYCDGLAKINVKKLICFHYKKKKLVTLTAVQPQHRYGVIKINKSIVISMNNNNPKQDIWINGGYFIINPISLNLIKKKNTYWEQEPINKLIKNSKKEYQYR